MGKGVGLSTLIFIVFLILKLAEIGVVATWSWVWVLSPLWIPFVLVIGILLVMLLIGGSIATAFSIFKSKKK